MGLTSAQRYNKRMHEIFEYAKKVGAIDDKVTCTVCMKVIREKDTDMMGRCKTCRMKNKMNRPQDVTKIIKSINKSRGL